MTPRAGAQPDDRGVVMREPLDNVCAAAGQVHHAGGRLTLSFASVTVVVTGDGWTARRGGRVAARGDDAESLQTYLRDTGRMP